MSKHLPGKVAKLIGDFRTLGSLVDLIEHEMEKRIVARHALVKLDALLKLVARYKNELRTSLHKGRSAPVANLEALISRLRRDYEGSDMETARDAMTAHALKLDLMRLVETWQVMGQTIFGVLASDLDEIDAELANVAGASHVAAGSALFEPSWQDEWRRTLGDPNQPRYATIYPGLATAGIVSPVPGGNPAQDATIRAVGLATFIRQVRTLIDAVPHGSTADRLFTEIMLNDYVALWELLFSSSVQNEHGQPDLSVLDHWTQEGWKGAPCLSQLQGKPHPDFDKWRQVRNTASAHVDPDLDIWELDPNRWPFKAHELMNEALRAIEAFRQCASHDLRSKMMFMPPSQFPPTVIGLSAQKGRHWHEA